MKGATVDELDESGYHDVSIHAPREGRDVDAANGEQPASGFNPRAP